MTRPLPIDVCLANAEKRISEAARAFHAAMRSEVPSEELKRAARASMLVCEREVRDFYEEATKSGWTGDVDALLAQHWATYLPQINAETLKNIRLKAQSEAAEQLKF